MEKAVGEIYRKVFVNNSQLNFRYQRQTMIQKKIKGNVGGDHGKNEKQMHKIGTKRVENQNDSANLMRAASSHAMPTQEIAFRAA